MAGFKIKKGDQVVILTGRDKGKKGEVLKVLPEENRVVVAGVNLIKRHQRPDQKNTQGGIISREAPLHISNVALADPKTGKGSRVGYKFLENGEKVRVAKKSGEVVA